MRKRLGLLALCALGLLLFSAACRGPKQEQSQETTVIINPTPLPQDATITGVTIQPAGTITLTRRLVDGVCTADQDFTADVTGTGNFYKRVGWVVTPLVTGVSLTSAREEPPLGKFRSTVKGEFKVYAYSTQDYSKRSPDTTVVVVGDCSGGGPGPGPGPQPERPVIHLRAEPDRVDRGNASNLIFSSERCDAQPIASGGWSGSKAFTGNEFVRPTVDTSYTLGCSNAAGEAVVTVVVRVTQPPVGVNPSCSLTVIGKNPITSGESTTLSLTSANGVSAVKSWSTDTLTLNGQWVVSPTTTTTYSVVVNGASGTVPCQASAVVTVTPPPQQVCPTSGIDYRSNSGSFTAFVNRNVSGTASTPSPWPSYCQLAYRVDRPSILKVLSADAVYEIFDASGNNPVWYYAGRNFTLTGIAPGTANVSVIVIQIGSDGKWRLVSGGGASHTWTVNP